MILFVVAASGLLDSIVVVDVVIEWSTSLDLFECKTGGEWEVKDALFPTLLYFSLLSLVLFLLFLMITSK